MILWTVELLTTKWLIKLRSCLMVDCEKNTIACWFVWTSAKQILLSKIYFLVNVFIFSNFYEFENEMLFWKKIVNIKIFLKICKMWISNPWVRVCNIANMRSLMTKFEGDASTRCIVSSSHRDHNRRLISVVLTIACLLTLEMLKYDVTSSWHS